ncbi:MULTISPECIES: hypothetical protein [unclassified Gemella]|uniref:hypothetical protein n=1 Tax=unclassified Gemella TaxID=2624949 RepID=UPI0015CF9E84|nr:MULTISPECIES: hypothetical protein [unclassified Gemella]MBF0709973.1 hypothetical protein [Gemella sp. GL1.1]NYS27317.1 hypothetical protein [Gemella sp. GL1]
MSMIMEFFNKVFDFLFLMEDGEYSYKWLIVGALAGFLSVKALQFYSKNKEKKENRL